MLELELPWPAAALSPNARVDWHVHAAAKSAYKNSCYLLARNARQLAPGPWPMRPPVTVLITFVLPDKRRRDFDNLLASFKSGLDGIVEAGVIEDDSVEKIRLGLEAEYGKAGVRVRLQGS